MEYRRIPESNQATLSYNGNTTNSNIAYGEILDVLTATKTAIEGNYTPGELVTYVVPCVTPAIPHLPV